MPLDAKALGAMQPGLGGLLGLVGDVINAQSRFKGMNPMNLSEGARPYYGGGNVRGRETGNVMEFSRDPRMQFSDRVGGELTRGQANQIIALARQYNIPPNKMDIFTEMVLSRNLLGTWPK